MPDRSNIIGEPYAPADRITSSVALTVTSCIPICTLTPFAFKMPFRLVIFTYKEFTNSEILTWYATDNVLILAVFLIRQTCFQKCLS